MKDRFIWSSKYEIGIELIDQQHQKLFELGNQLFGSSVEDIDLIIMEFFKYTNYHFKAEEDLLGEYECYNLKVHHQIHEDLIEQLSNLTEGGIKTVEQLQEFRIFVLKWLSNHILVEDVKCCNALKTD